MAGDVVFVRRVGTVEKADIIAAWLKEQGIEATVWDRSNTGAMAFGLTDSEGFAICVTDEEAAARAKALLAEHDEAHSHASTGKEMDIKCGECGETANFECEAQPTVQSCPECGANIDIPGADG